MCVCVCVDEQQKPVAYSKIEWLRKITTNEIKDEMNAEKERERVSERGTLSASAQTSTAKASSGMKK